MGKVKLTLPGLEIPVTGKQISFKAPCDCSSVECIQIDGVDYCVVDALGRQVTGVSSGGAWVEGAQVSVVLDCENRKAYIQNGGAVRKSGDTMTGALGIDEGSGAQTQVKNSSKTAILRNLVDNDNYHDLRIGEGQCSYRGKVAGTPFNYSIVHAGNMASMLNVYGKMATGSYVGTGTYGASNPNSIVCGFAPKLVVITNSQFPAYGGAWVVGADKGIVNIWGSDYQSVFLTGGENGVSWYSDSSYTSAPHDQLNHSEYTYNWVAIG